MSALVAEKASSRFFELGFHTVDHRSPDISARVSKQEDYIIFLNIDVSVEVRFFLISTHHQATIFSVAPTEMEQ